MAKLVIENVSDFDLGHILDCGQAFRWTAKGDGSFVGLRSCREAVGPAKISFISDSPPPGAGTVVIEHEGGDAEAEASAWRRYLDLDRDYGEIKRQLSKDDEVMAEAITYGEGIRILNQDPWETLISFIISQRSNIPRIKGCVESLCQAFGRPAGTLEGKEYYSFPDAEALAAADAAKLASCRLGYRAGYIVGAARRVLELGGPAYLEGLRHMEYEEAMAELLLFHGVGHKVASCVLLFGLGHMEGFPVDVWIARAMRLYNLTDNRKNAVHAFARERFYGYAGIAQQYLFFYIREREKKV